MNWFDHTLQMQAKSDVEPNEEYKECLTSGVYRLDRRGQNLRVVSGYAWVTMDDQDIILTKGQEMYITPGKSPVLVEALRKQPLLFVVST